MDSTARSLVSEKVRPCYTHMHVLYTCTAHALHIHCTCTAHTLHMHCTCTAHALHKHCTCTVHAHLVGEDGGLPREHAAEALLHLVCVQPVLTHKAQQLQCGLGLGLGVGGGVEVGVGPQMRLRLRLRLLGLRGQSPARRAARRCR